MRNVSSKCFSIARRTQRLVLAFLALQGSTVAFAQRPPDIGGILDGISNAYKKARPYEIVATTTMLGTVNANALLTSKVRLVSQDANTFRLESYNSDDINGVPTETFPSMLILGDGAEIWKMSSRFKLYTKTKPNDLATIRTWVKAAETEIFDIPMAIAKRKGNLTFLREESLALDGNKSDCFVLKLDLPDRPESTTLWVEKARFLIRRTRSEEGPSADTQDRTASITTDFPVVNIGVTLPGNTFVFNPPFWATEVVKTTP